MQAFAETLLPYAVLAGVFLGSLLLVVAVYAYASRRRLEAERIVRERLRDDSTGRAVQAPARLIRDDRTASSVPLLNRVLEGKGLTGAVQGQLDRSGATLTVGAFLMIVALSASTLAFVGVYFAGAAIGIVLGLVGGVLPFAILQREQSKRVKAFEAQLPDAVDMLVNAMRAGYSLQAAMKFIGDEVADPLGPEFTRFYDEQRLGIDVRTALLNLQARNATLDVRMFVTALLLQRESGGNLAEIMNNLSVLMRERVALRGQLDVLTAEPRMSAVVLTGVPPLLFLVMNTINHEYVSILYLTETGRTMIAYGVVSLVIGYVVLQKMGRVDF